MEQIWKRNEPDSPCVKVCVMHPDAKICIGCYRTIDEISRWIAMDGEVRIALKQELPARAIKLIGKRRGGRRRVRRDNADNPT